MYLNIISGGILGGCMWYMCLYLLNLFATNYFDINKHERNHAFNSYANLYSAQLAYVSRVMINIGLILSVIIGATISFYYRPSLTFISNVYFSYGDVPYEVL